MRSLATVSTLSFVGVLSAMLAGCPVWGPEMGTPTPTPDGGIIRRDSGPTPDAVTPPTPCDRNDQCANNQYCNAATHECVTTPTCAPNSPCPTGYTCDARGACVPGVPGCSSTADCQSQGTGLVCNTDSGRCVPGGICMTDANCTVAGEVCVAGSCRAPATLCRFNYQCGAGQECVDGRCLAQCRVGGTACPSGQTCTNGYCQYPTTGTCSNCAMGEVCSSGVCLRTCMTDTQCGAGNFCDHGACRVDDRRPSPFCTAPDVGCASGSVCVDGVCRISCPMGTSDECMRRDVNFNTCDAQRICRYSNELSPECQRNAECSNNRVCVNATCR